MKLRLAFSLLFLASAAALFASREKPVIGLSLDTLKEERWQRDRDTFIAEAEKLGFEKIILSKYNTKSLGKLKFNIEVVPLAKVEELYQYLF